jgi:hypothetical protein
MGNSLCIVSTILKKDGLFFALVTKFLHISDTSHFGEWTDIFVPLVMQKCPISQDNLSGYLIDSIYI